MTSAPTIHVVDDDASFRNSMARLLRAAGYQVALYESGNQFLENPPLNRAGCILLDMQMSGLNGLELQKRLVGSESILPIVFLTGHGNIPMSVQAMKEGAEDFLSKPVGKKALLECVERALSRYSAQRQQCDRMETMRSLVANLTPRETEVFCLIVKGKLNKQIANALGTSERTIKAHRHAVMEKLKVQSFAEAVAIAERLGMLDAPGPGNS